jgi:hypothetical protein
MELQLLDIKPPSNDSTDWVKVNPFDGFDPSLKVTIKYQPVVGICFPISMIADIMPVLGVNAVSAFLVPFENAHAIVQLPEQTLNVTFEHETVIVAISWKCPRDIVATLGTFGINPFLLRSEDWRRLSRDCADRLMQSIPSFTIDRLGPCALSILEPFLRCANLPPISGLGMLGLTAKSVAGRCLHSVLCVTLAALNRAGVLPK